MKDRNAINVKERDFHFEWPRKQGYIYLPIIATRLSISYFKFGIFQLFNINNFECECKFALCPAIFEQNYWILKVENACWQMNLSTDTT